MNIYFKSKSVQKACAGKDALIKKWGKKHGMKVAQRLKELSAATNLSHISVLPPPRMHELSGERKGEYVVDVGHAYRLIFKPNHNPVPKKDDGGIALEKVTSILILSIENYH